MFGDEITIRTRRDYGVGREHGQPLVVEIKGLSGIVVIRPGSNDQPVGTTVEIRGRRKYFTVDRWSDPVNLVQVLKGYALAVEFPVTASCTVPAIQERVEISPGATARPHPLEEADVSAKDTFIGSFSEVDERLGGQVRVCTLTDEGGIPAPANTEARVKLVTGRTSMDVERKVVFASGEEAVGRWDIHRFDRVCCDGILVAGEPAWHGERLLLGYSALNTGFGGGSLLLDARGDLKPALTPARTPIDSNRQEPSWVRLFEAASPAYSKVLLQVLDRCTKSGEPDRFWIVAEAYELDVYHLPLSDTWEKLRFPIGHGDDPIQWVTASELGRPRATLPTAEKQSLRITFPDDRFLRIPSSISSLQLGERARVTVSFFERLIMGLSKMTILSPTEFELTLHEPDPGACLADVAIREFPAWHWFFRFAGDLARAVCVTGETGFANAEHAIVRSARSRWPRPWDEYPPLERIMARLMYGQVGGPVDSELPAKSLGARNRKQLGMLYGAVDWSAVDPLLKPPYYVFRPGTGIENVTSDHLARWATIPVANDE